MSDEQTGHVPPVEIGQVLREQKCINNGKKNDGVVKYEGYIIFVNNCSEGDIVSFEIEKVLPKFGIGKKIEDEEEWN